MITPAPTLGQKIKRLRLANKHTQDKLANAMGVSRSAVTQWETDRAAPTHHHTQAICSLFNVRADFFFEGNQTMTFAVRNLSVLAYASGFTLWHYKIGNANLAETRAPWFFNDASDMFAAGDMVLVSGTDGGTILVVAQASHGVIVAPMTP